jgi:hypothetical protein
MEYTNSCKDDIQSEGTVVHLCDETFYLGSRVCTQGNTHTPRD